MLYLKRELNLLFATRPSKGRINNSRQYGGSGGPGEDHQLHHSCWTGRVGEREEEEEDPRQNNGR